jgi:hypothetical protein
VSAKITAPGVYSKIPFTNKLGEYFPKILCHKFDVIRKIGVDLLKEFIIDKFRQREFKQVCR